MMKIRHIEIDSYNQFKNLKINLTYPPGHKKAGQPLDKICFIGQSGTGKTTLLNIIKDIFAFSDNSIYSSYTITTLNDGTIYTIRSNAGGRKTYSNPGQKPSNVSNVKTDFINQINKPDTALIYLPADFLGIRESDIEPIIKGQPNIFDFGAMSVNDIWNRILDRVKEHQDMLKRLRGQITNLTIGGSGDEMDQKLPPLIKKLKELENVDNNPLKNLAKDCLDDILALFNLKVITDYAHNDDLSSIEFIRIADKNGNEIPNGFLSTGTSQFILSMIPFYILRPNDTVILFDEPERSLYPDIQKKLIEHHSNFINNCQLFYATHSPIIASCFDPWEVIELKFNPEGYVYQEIYYEGDRHVNNYKVHPKYLTYELILKKVFDVDETEGDNRAELKTAYKSLEAKLNLLKKEGKNTGEDFDEVLKEYKKLGELLSWPAN